QVEHGREPVRPVRVRHGDEDEPDRQADGEEGARLGRVGPQRHHRGAHQHHEEPDAEQRHEQLEEIGSLEGPDPKRETEDVGALAEGVDDRLTDPERLDVRVDVAAARDGAAVDREHACEGQAAIAGVRPFRASDGDHDAVLRDQEAGERPADPAARVPQAGGEDGEHRDEGQRHPPRARDRGPIVDAIARCWRLACAALAGGLTLLALSPHRLGWGAWVASGPRPVRWCAGLWAGWESVRTLVFPYCPAAVLGLSQHATVAVLQLASLTGVAGVSFVLLACNVGLASLIAPSGAHGRARAAAAATGIAAAAAAI